MIVRPRRKYAVISLPGESQPGEWSDSDDQTLSIVLLRPRITGRDSRLTPPSLLLLLLDYFPYSFRSEDGRSICVFIDIIRKKIDCELHVVLDSCVFAPVSIISIAPFNSVLVLFVRILHLCNGATGDLLLRGWEWHTTIQYLACRASDGFQFETYGHRGGLPIFLKNRTDSYS